MNTWFIIPARKGSKRFPLKNRKLVPICLSQLDSEWVKNTIVSTNDRHIREIAEKFGAAVHDRSEENASDSSSMRETLKEVIADKNISENDTIVCLYPTYPQRNADIIHSSIGFFISAGADSMLCKKTIKSHPYLFLRDIGDNKGELFIENNLYRWQDFPKCFQYSHFIVIFKVSEIENLNFQLFNKDTVYFDIPESVDVDSESDFKSYLSLEKNKPS